MMVARSPCSNATAETAHLSGRFFLFINVRHTANYNTERGLMRIVGNHGQWDNKNTARIIYSSLNRQVYSCYNFTYVIIIEKKNSYSLVFGTLHQILVVNLIMIIIIMTLFFKLIL